jgi:hypothetical protein
VSPLASFKPVGVGITMLSHSKLDTHMQLIPVPTNWFLSGSYFHAWMLKSYSNLVHRSCFVDPVAFGSWEGGE